MWFLNKTHSNVEKIIKIMTEILFISIVFSVAILKICKHPVLLPACQINQELRSDSR